VTHRGPFQLRPFCDSVDGSSLSAALRLVRSSSRARGSPRINLAAECMSRLSPQNRIGAVSQLQYELGKILCDVHSCDGVVIAG